MNKEIAVLENYNGETASFSESGLVKIYVKQSDRWKVKDEIIFSLCKIENINLLREKIISMVKSLGECKIFIGRKIGGIPYSILERFGVNSWEISGRPGEFLNYVIEKEEDEQRKSLEHSSQCEEKCSHCEDNCVCNPIETEQQGHYFLDLIKVQQQNPSITTKQILIPFFKKQDFSQLIIKCSHVPKWFERGLTDFNLEWDVQLKEQGQLNVIVKCKT